MYLANLAVFEQSTLFMQHLQNTFFLFILFYTASRRWPYCSRSDGSGSASLPRRMEDLLKEEKNSNADLMYIHVCTYVV
jgi:hypothetical protein